MAIFLVTTTPKRLLRLFKKAIDDGHVETWSYDADGDFSHTPEQWTGKAWLRPRVDPNTRLILNILRAQDVELNVETYGVYHGRFIESILTHCDRLLTEARASALPIDGDHI